ncbi:MAG: NSFL1 cofactor p47 [Marteilia pararefringens]
MAGGGSGDSVVHDDDSKIKKFLEITNSSNRETAKFWLESSVDLETAIDNYMSHTSTSRGSEQPIAPIHDPFSYDPNKDSRLPSSSSSSKQKKSAMRTFSQINAESEEEEKRLAKYNHYRASKDIQVIGAPIAGEDGKDDRQKDSVDPNENKSIPQQFMDSVRNLIGKTAGKDTLDEEGPSFGSKQLPGFSFNNQGQAGSSAVSSNGPGQVRLNLKVYNDGFKFQDDDEPRYFSNQKDLEFFKTIQNGAVPHEISQKYPNKIIDIAIEQKDENLPKQTRTGFSFN